jgi:hypothetical protein
LRSTPRTLAVLASLLAVLALSGVAAGATAKQSSTPEKWVSTFCGSLVTWEQTVKTSSTKLASTIAALKKKSGKVDVPVAKAKLLAFMNVLVGSTDKLVRQIKAVGTPSVANGDKLQKGVLQAFGQIDTSFKQARTATHALPSDPKGFSKGALAISSTITASTSRVGAAFNALQKYDSTELEAAAKKTPACLKIGG